LKRRQVEYYNLLEALIEEALQGPLPSGGTFAERLGRAAEEKPLEALCAFAAYLLVHVQAEVRNLAKLHLVAVR
jgi:hypothetical protein